MFLVARYLHKKEKNCMKKNCFGNYFRVAGRFFNTRRLLFLILITVEILSTIDFLIYSEIYKKKFSKKGFLKRE